MQPQIDGTDSGAKKISRRTKTGDRTNGTSIKVTGHLQDAIIAAAEKIGRDGNGKEGRQISERIADQDTGDGSGSMRH